MRFKRPQQTHARCSEVARLQVYLTAHNREVHDQAVGRERMAGTALLIRHVVIGVLARVHGHRTRGPTRAGSYTSSDSCAPCGYEK